MKVVNATWEKRNLGVSCTEVTVADDSLEAVREVV